MTERRLNKYLYAILTVVLIIGIVEAAMMLSDVISLGMSEGLMLAIKRVIPTAFPFMIISDLFLAYARPEYIPVLPRVFRAIYSLPERCLGAALIGSVCGFPIGAKIASDMYVGGLVTKEDAEVTIAYSSAPSPAFVIGVVGGGMLGDITRGVMLLFAIHLGTAIVAQFRRRKVSNITISDISSRQRFSFVESVKSAGMASISIAAFISVFALIKNLVVLLIPFEPLKAVIISLLEVTGACEFFAGISGFSDAVRMALIGFSLGFGGVSVACQTAAFSARCGLSIMPYLLIKLLSGIATSFIAVILTLLVI